MTAARALSDVERLLRRLAQERVAQLARALAPVHPERVAEDVVCSRLNLTPVMAHRRQLVVAIADFVRELRAAPDDAE